jgi:hypothetical protein
MSVAQGYEKIPTNGLVFMYDVADSTSYKGEPTTNLINPNGPGIYTWWGRNVQTITQLTETYKGQPIYRVSLSIDDGDMLYHITARWGAGSGWYLSSTTYYANTPYMASVIYRPVSHADTRVYGHPSNISGWGLNIDDSIDLDNGWKQHKIDRNYGTTVGDNRFHHMHTPSAIIGQTVTVDITNSQIEAKSYSTPFVNGTRSATEGLKDLTNTTEIDLSNVSFDANAQMLWDGTNDTMAIADYTTHKPGQPFSYEIVFKPLGGGTSYDKMLIGKPGWHTGIMYQYSYIWFRTRYGSPAFYDTGTVNVIQGNYYHVVATYTSGTSMKLYVNGVLVADNNSIPSALVDIGNTLNIGGSSVNYSCYVEIPAAKTYNQALTQAEVQQSYNKYKTRFNLS